MDTTIRNVDKEAYRALKTYAAHHGLTVGEALSQIVLQHVGDPIATRLKRGSLADLPRVRFPPGNERLSEEIDEIVYGV